MISPHQYGIQNEECQRFPASPSPTPFSTRTVQWFLFCCSAAGSVGEVWVGLVYVSCSRICHTRKATRGHTLFLIKNTISAEASPSNLLIREVTQLPLVQTTAWGQGSELQKREIWLAESQVLTLTARNSKDHPARDC